MGKELVLAHVLCRGRRTSRFYVFDLEANKVLETPVAVSHESGDAGIVRLGSRIYVVGGRRPDDDYDYDDDEEDEEDSQLGDGDQYIHSSGGTSYFDLPKLSILNQPHNNTCHSIDNPVKFISPSHNTWKQLPPTASSHPILSYPACASLGGKIYALTFSSLYCFGDVFDPQSQEWKCLPPLDLPKGCFGVSSHVFPDEKNDRLLVHFRGAPVLCAYYPATTNWECLDTRNFWRPCSSTSALVDGVLYSHIQTSDFLLAYDVTTKSQLKVVHSSPFPLPYRVSDFLQMIHLGDGMLCLTDYAHLHIPEAGLTTTRVQFARFRVKRANLQEVHVTHVAFNSFSFENLLIVSDCLAL